MGENLSGSWELTVFPTSSKSYEEVFGQRRPSLQFDHVKSIVSGTTGCNHINGKYTVTEDQISFDSNMAMTKMACPGYEETIFLNALKNVNRFEITDGQLKFYRDETQIMGFERKE